MNNHLNIVRVKAVANALNRLSEKVVFVGGATVSFYADKRVVDVRPTDDVDVIIEILTYGNRAKLEDRLREVGFLNDIASPVVCRFKIEGISVDIMPTNDPSIGFTNKWYSEGFKYAVPCTIEPDFKIEILSAPYFIGTKLEAYKSRGKGDGRTSHDFEDIVFVLENRELVWTEMQNCNESLKEYLVEEFRKLLQNNNVFDWIDGHVERGSPPASYWILDKLKSFVGGY